MNARAFRLTRTGLAALVILWPLMAGAQAVPPNTESAQSETLPLPPSQATVTKGAAGQGAECIGDGAHQLPPVRITIDGEPLDSREGHSEADRERCVDVALARTDLQLRYDPLEQQPFLNALAQPALVMSGQTVHFATYSNYVRYIARAEIRLFGPDQSVKQQPISVLSVAPGHTVDWTASDRQEALSRVVTPLGLPDHALYVLRVYDRDGHFDETKPKRLDFRSASAIAAGDPIREAEAARNAELKAFGENALAVHNIATRGGAITVSGSHVPLGNHVRVLDADVPVDSAGRFVVRQILPGGPQAITVQILNDAGEGLSFRRNLSVATDDAFFVGIADLIGGERSVSGPVALVTGDPTLARTGYVDGHLAFYYKGLVKGSWLLTAAADTQEQPLRDLFSNFARKDPEYLLRQIDPDRFYPVYGDDSTTVQDAPTAGKFYVRLQRDGSEILWGDFKTQLTGTEFLQYTRTLYGIDAKFRSLQTTSYGEKRSSVDGFWADPGTLSAREEFRGTGGSVYYLQNLDISVGSEQVWVQVRDRDSGIVQSMTQLVPSQDYDVNYLQGRILLHEALSATADVATFVHDASLSGNPVYLIVTYEYVPGFTSPKSLALGGRASEWFGDHLQLGVSAFHQGDTGEEQNLRGVDATFRYKPGTYIKTEYAHSDGTGTPTETSITGGLTTQSLATDGSGAGAKRVEAAVDLSEVTDSAKGRIALYHQDRDANFSGPGQLTPGVGVRQDGGAATVPIGTATQIVAKVDSSRSETQTSDVDQLGIEHALDEHWRVALGARRDDLETPVANASPTLSQNGVRTDVGITVGYRPSFTVVAPTAVASVGADTPASNGSAPAPGANAAGTSPGSPTAPAAASTTAATQHAAVAGAAVLSTTSGPGLLTRGQAPWDVYAFAQSTVERTGTRPQNDRVGLGGSERVTDDLRLGAEISDGSLGVGGKITSDYRLNDRSNAYLNYTLAADQPDALNLGRVGALTSGTRYRYDDSTSVYGEERLTTGTGPTGLTHAYGVDLAPFAHWTYGLKWEHGTVSDPLAGDQSVDAWAASAGYTAGKIKYASALEYRTNDSSVNGASHTLLTRNSVTYQVSPDWRVLGKLNWSQTDGAASSTLNAEYHEFVIGAGWRPVDNDCWNTLFKFTILDDQPSAAQITQSALAPQYSQRSRVFDIDVTRQTTAWLALGGKYAIRTGELKPTETAGDWFTSTTQLYVVRADFLWVRSWDGLVELRRLQVTQTRDATDGVLLALYRHVSEHLKAGIGYNFTNYSDDLTDLSYRSHGIFLNVLGKY